MKVYDASALALQAVSSNPQKPATVLAHDATDARVVIFRIEAGQRVPVHTSPSTVLLFVIEGHGLVEGADGERAVKPGDIIAYDMNEPHGMRAADERLVIAAVIAPRPGTR